MVDPVDETYRRTVTRQLNIGEGRHSLARKIFHGHLGDIMQAYRAGQEDQLGALGLVLNAVVLFNTRYIDMAVNVLRGQGYPVRDEDAARSPRSGTHTSICWAATPSPPRPPTSGCARCATRMQRPVDNGPKSYGDARRPPRQGSGGEPLAASAT
jgi:hypothetical protein